jgi:hypothetical protein
VVPRIDLGPLVRLEIQEGKMRHIVIGNTGGKPIVGSGKLETRSFDLKDFTAVEINGPFTLDLKQGKEFKVALTADDNLFEYIRVEKQGNRLVVGFIKGKNVSIQLDRDHALKVDVTLPELEALKLNGAARATAEGFKAGRPVRLDLNGASRLTGSLQGDRLTIDANGASSVKLAGSGKDLRIRMHGASRLRMGDFTASGDKLLIDANGAANLVLKGKVTAGVINAVGASHLDLREATLAAADVTLVGASHATVRVTEKLNYSVAGASHLDYFGDPKIGKSQKSDVSNVSRKE